MKAIAIVLLLVAVFIFLLPPSVVRLADPFHGPMKAIYRPPPPAPIENYVLTIEAESEREAYYRLGYAHAYYRLFQMDVMRRVAQGRLGELLGPAALDTDIYFRTRGLYISAEKSWLYIESNFPNVATVVLEYVNGVNDFITQNPPPIEYLILGKKPEPWAPTDVIAIVKLVAWSLSGGEADLELKRLADRLGQRFLEIALSRRQNTPILPRKAVFSPPRDAGDNWIISPHASNNWIISPQLSATNCAMLANDPHLLLSAPPIWIFQRVKTPGREVVGVAFPGTPLVTIGTNGHVAWGFTNTGIDVIDYYYYVWDGDRYFHNGTWREANRRVEEFKTCDADGRCSVWKVTVLETVHGPVVEYGGTRYAMRWLGNNITLEAVAMYEINRAKNLSDFLKALRYFITPSQNVVYADLNGTVAYFASGYLPLRNGGYLPFNGSRGEGEWGGYAWLPTVLSQINPPYLATANNKVADADVYLQWRWADRYRHDRIVELLAERLGRSGKVTVRDVMEIQLDVVDISCRDVKLLLKTLGGESSEKLLRELENWDCAMIPTSTTAAKYATFLYNLQKRAWEDFGVSLTLVPLEVTIEAIKSGLLDRRIVEEVAAEALKTSKPWGEMHVYDIRHVMGSVFPSFNYRKTEAPGSWFTVNVAPGSPGSEFRVSQGPSVRLIVAFCDGIYMSLPGGPDGDPLSPLYDAMYLPWVRGEYVKVG